ncbi:MAG: hypothetical protein ACFFBD_10150 [Candidatus Hodarchaeota archaeon]
MKNVAGLKIWKKKCPKCGKPMFIKECPCFIRKKGFKLCARCLSCGKIIGIKR